MARHAKRAVLSTRWTLAALFTSLITLVIALNITIATWFSRLLAWGSRHLWSPYLPTKYSKPIGARPRVAVIGAGVTGVSSAAACIRSGVDVVIYEATDRVGGIWSRVNATSSLQFQSLFYRFHPTVRFLTDFPKRDEILSEVKRIWRTYDLHTRTRFNTKVQSVSPNDDGTWTVDNEIFDGVVTAVGTCGEQQVPSFPGIEKFEGKKVHSSEMDSVEFSDEKSAKGLKLVVLGSGASAVECVDYVLSKLGEMRDHLGSGEGKVELTIIARHDKWLMPRGVLSDAVASILPYWMGWIFERALRTLWYGSELRGMTPNKPFFASTPCLNNEYLSLIREGKIRYIRGTVKDFSANSVTIDKVEWDSYTMLGKDARSPKEGLSIECEADGICYATGYKKPSFDFIDDRVWKGADGQTFSPPNLFLVAFPPKYPTLMFLNDAYVDAIATAGHIHIGLLTRYMLINLLDKKTRKPAIECTKWIEKRQTVQTKKEYDSATGIRSTTRGGYNRWEDAGLGFYSYGELLYWVGSQTVASLSRFKYTLYLLGLYHGQIIRLAHKYSREHEHSYNKTPYAKIAETDPSRAEDSAHALRQRPVSVNAKADKSFGQMPTMKAAAVVG